MMKGKLMTLTVGRDIVDYLLGFGNPKKCAGQVDDRRKRKDKMDDSHVSGATR